MALNDVFQLSQIGKYLGGTYVNSFHFRQVSDLPAGANPAVTLASDWETNTPATWVVGKVNDLSLERVAVRSVQPLNTWLGEVPFNPVATGDDVMSDALPPQIAMVVSWRTAQAGRRFRGRTYVGGIPETDIVNGTWAAIAVTRVQAWIDFIIGRYVTNAATNAFQLGIWSRPVLAHTRYDPKTGVGTPVPARAGVFTPITTALIRPTAMTQRRRSLGVGG